MTVGYCTGRNMAIRKRLRRALKRSGCRVVFSDDVSCGPNFMALVHELSDGDEIVVYRIKDIVSGNFHEYVKIMDRLKTTGIVVKSLSEGMISSERAIEGMVFTALATVAVYQIETGYHY